MATLPRGGGEVRPGEPRRHLPGPRSASVFWHVDDRKILRLALDEGVLPVGESRGDGVIAMLLGHSLERFDPMAPVRDLGLQLGQL
jgi:hypothetical protein